MYRIPFCISHDYGYFVKGIATRHEKNKEYRKYTYLDYLEDVEEFQKDIASKKI